ncbi:MAG: hypothetical protein JOZ29_19290 [Deltaproteobacteria bacterium]|nr:hypothetical protein [Deltaproteobacteria bacterium]
MKQQEFSVYRPEKVQFTGQQLKTPEKDITLVKLQKTKNVREFCTLSFAPCSCA